MATAPLPLGRSPVGGESGGTPRGSPAAAYPSSAPPAPARRHTRAAPSRKVDLKMVQEWFRPLRKGHRQPQKDLNPLLARALGCLLVELQELPLDRVQLPVLEQHRLADREVLVRRGRRVARRRRRSGRGLTNGAIIVFS